MQTVDEVIATVVGMGFSLEDAQQAIQGGKLQPDQVIDWILAGKPRLEEQQQQQGHTLRLGQARVPDPPPYDLGTNPFALPPHPIAMATASSATENPQEHEEDEKLVVSRMHLNDEQRRIRDTFEEKQRNEAQRSAKLERQAQKKAKDAILLQIKEDRETVRMKKSAKAEPEQTAGSEAAATSQTSPDKPQTSLLQIRMPDGRALRKTFSADAILNEVWSLVDSKFPATSYILIQPFPRREFATSDLNTTLLDLGLVPTGSLVLKKCEKPVEQATAEVTTESADTGTAEAMETDEDNEGSGASNSPLQLPPPQLLPHLPPTAHQWGLGNAMLPEHEEGNADEAMPDEENSEDDDVPPPDFMGQMPWPPGAGGIGMAGGGGHFWGAGQAVVGEVIEAANLPHHNRNPGQLAAEAARQRYGHNPPVADIIDSSCKEETVLQTIPSLLRLLLSHVGRRLSGGEMPPIAGGLHRLPADVATTLLRHLVQERLLRPKTMHTFVSCRLRKMVLDCYPYTTNELLQALRLHSYVTHLSLVSCPLINDRGLQPLTALHRLKFLNLAQCAQLTDNCMTVITEYRQLVTLVLEGTGVQDAGVLALCQSAPQHLQHLDVSRTAVTHAILPHLQTLTNLRILNLENTQVSSLYGLGGQLASLSVAATPLVTDSMMCLTSLHSLTALNISRIDRIDGDTALRHIAGLQLQYLQLPSRLNTSNSGLQHLVSMPLLTLDLTNFINIGDEGMKSVGKIHSLKKLRLGNTKITDVGLTYLGGLTNLEELVLDRTDITNTGATLIKDFKNLQELSLAETNITNGLLVSRVLNACSLLGKLNLARTKVTHKGVQYLHLPCLLLLNLDNTRVRGKQLLLSSNCPQLSSVSLRAVRTPPNSGDEDE